MDNRRYNRLAFRVLDHDPTEEDVRDFLSEFKGQLDKRGLVVLGITTDGSSLYHKVLKELWPDARHQICAFHVIKEITKAVLHALAVLRKELTALLPRLPRGRPSKEDQPLANKAKRRKQRVADLFEKARLQFQKDPAKAAALATKPLGPAPKEMNVVDLAAWTVVANVLLNLDETLAKR